jgi:hypothetical protein
VRLGGVGRKGVAKERAVGLVGGGNDQRIEQAFKGELMYEVWGVGIVGKMLTGVVLYGAERQDDADYEKGCFAKHSIESK